MAKSIRLRRPQQIGAESHDNPPLRAPTRRRSARPWRAVGPAAALVLATVGIGIVIVHYTGNTDGAALNGVVGYRWRVATITDTHGTAKVPRAWGAVVTVSPDKTVGADDTVNRLSAHYRPLSTGYVLTVSGVTSHVSYHGDDQVRIRTINAIDTLFGFSDGKQVSDPTVVRVFVDLMHDGVLNLHRDGETVTAMRAGAQA